MVIRSRPITRGLKAFEELNQTLAGMCQGSRGGHRQLGRLDQKLEEQAAPISVFALIKPVQFHALTDYWVKLKGSKQLPQQ